MSRGVNALYPNEVVAIQTAAKNNPKIGSAKLANQIKAGKYGDTTGYTVRTVYSILNVVRRFRANQNKAAAI